MRIKRNDCGRNLTICLPNQIFLPRTWRFIVLINKTATRSMAQPSHSESIRVHFLWIKNYTHILTDTHIIHKYNPPKHGRAYYFSKSGNQIRKVRIFSIDLEKCSKEKFDETTDTSCQNSYHIVSKKVLFIFVVLPISWSLL